MADWTKQELDVLWDVYSGMLECQRKGIPFVKTQMNALVQEATGRSKGAIEYKFCNFSAVLNDLGLDYVDGYAPYSNYQAAMRTLVEDWIALFSTNALTSTQKSKFELTDVQISEKRDQVVAASSQFEFFWGQSTGGASVAVYPGDDSPPSVESPRPPGVAESLEWFGSGRGSGGHQKILFLVGGPGAGKSHAARAACMGLREIEPIKDGLAQRTYRYQTTGRDLLVVNDATIGSDVHEFGALIGDIEHALTEGFDLLACINRGVVVEELRIATESSVSQSVSAGIMRWLHLGHDSQWISGDAELISTNECEYLRTAEVTLSNGTMVEIVSVFLDVCSLLEIRPEVRWVDSRDGCACFEAETYSVTSFLKRSSLTEERVPGLKLIANVVGSVPSTADFLPDDWNPFEANRRTLSDNAIASSLCSIFRAAEIVSTIRFTYRELWGAVVRSLFGRAPEEVLPTDFVGWIKDRVHVSDSAVNEFAAMQALAAYRYSEAIFGSELESESSNSVCRMLRPVDPILDARPGSLTVDKTDGWATPVYDAFSGGSREDSPLESLLRSNHWENDHIHAAVTQFERKLDDAFVRLRTCGALSESELNRATSWYGAYLLRLYAVSNGIPAFFVEVGEWTKLWFSKPSVPSSLEEPLATLLLPRRNPDSPYASYLLPLLDSRTVPIQNEAPESRLAVRGESVEVSIETHGDAAVARLTKGGSVVGRIECDFPLIREALSCASGHLGITEFTHSVSPRLERFRASQLLANRVSSAQLRVVSRNGEDVVQIRKQK